MAANSMAATVSARGSSARTAPLRSAHLPRQATAFTGHRALPKQGLLTRLRKLQASEGSETSPAKDEFQYEFGRPAAPKSTWQRFANEGRDDLLAEMKKEDWDIDVLDAALALACEDDSMHGRSVVKLPTDSYSKRMTTMVGEVIRIHLPKLEDDSPKAKLDCIDNYLYNLQKFKRAEGVLEVFSPYRMYAHNVLAQKCGISAALGVVHLSLLQRLKAQGALDGVDFELVLPVTGERPFARVAGADGASGDSFGTVLTPRSAVLIMLDTLKRSFWPWEWAIGATSGFLPAAEAAIGKSGRIGTANSTTGVLQASGRPYGDLERSLLASERLVLLEGGLFHMRDTGILLYHLSRHQEAYDVLSRYLRESENADDADEDIYMLPDLVQKKSTAGMRTELELIAEERKLTEAVVAKLERMKAESSWAL